MLPNVDLFRLLVVARGAQDDQPQVLVVNLDLGPLVGVQRVLHRQFMQPEEEAHLVHFRFPGLEQAKPHEAILVAPGRRFLQRHRAVIAPEAVLVVGAVDDHLGNSLSGARAGSPVAPAGYPPGPGRL